MVPGSTEKWKITNSGDTKDKISAEVLTAMYDASLDQFKKQNWTVPDLYPAFPMGRSWSGIDNFDDQRALIKLQPENQRAYYYKQYDQLISPVRRMGLFKENSMAMNSAPGPVAKVQIRGMATLNGEVKKVVAGYSPPVIAEGGKAGQNAALPDKQVPGTLIRKNFNETAFFFPDLKTDAEGNVEVSFTMPEALTQWKWMIFAHTKDLSFGYSEKQVITQKELMLQPNMPRFFREGDSMQLPVKISNLSPASMSGIVQLDWLGATDNSNQNAALRNKTTSQPFNIEAGQSTVVYFSSVVPANFQQPVVYRL